jgi:hypothetical protein
MTCFVRIDLEGCQTEAALIGWINGALDFVTTLPVERSPKASCQREEGRHRPWSTRRDAEVPAYVIMKRPQLGARQRGSRGHQRLVTWAAPMQYRPIARTGQTWPRVHMVFGDPRHLGLRRRRFDPPRAGRAGWTSSIGARLNPTRRGEASSIAWREAGNPNPSRPITAMAFGPWFTNTAAVVRG